MRIAVMGTGGVGGCFGAKLARAGHDVAFVARGAHLAAMRAKGLRIESAAGEIVLPRVVATDDPASLAPVDVVMFCVKLWDTEGAARQLKPIVGPGTRVIPFQNGVESIERLRKFFPQEAVMGGSAYIASRISRPGVIEHIGQMQRLQFGPLLAEQRPVAERPSDIGPKASSKAAQVGVALVTVAA